MNRIGQERGWPPMQRPDYDAAATLRGANFVGTPEDVVKKILFQHELFGHDRFMIQFTIGGIPHEGILRSIELLGREVAPRVREALDGSGTASRIAEPATRGDNE
jgi:alkanesulfonate monooxygenase SsuD/methylene tetrahydromethanopterin reductase-like flavin-dependent oxidoreductase (luciferase family)